MRVFAEYREPIAGRFLRLLDEAGGRSLYLNHEAKAHDQGEVRI